MTLITFNKYMDNPSQGTSTFTNRSMYRQMYKQKFDALMVREQGQLAYKIHRTNDGNDTYFIHFKIPSEGIPNFYYDTVVELFTKKNELKNSATLREYNVRFFSNDQAFVYTFAYAFNKAGLFIPILRDKMMKRALTERALERNPRAEIWYVKSLAFAFYTMEKYGLFNRSMLNQRAVKYNHGNLMREVMNVVDKFEEHHRKHEELQRKRKQEREEIRRRQDQANLARSKFIITKTPNSNTIKSTKDIRKVKRIGRVGRIGGI